MTLAEALKRVHAVRSIAAPNENFMAQLEELERCGGDIAKAYAAHMQACE